MLNPPLDILSYCSSPQWQDIGAVTTGIQAYDTIWGCQIWPGSTYTGLHKNAQNSKSRWHRAYKQSYFCKHTGFIAWWSWTLLIASQQVYRDTKRWTNLPLFVEHLLLIRSTAVYSCVTAAQTGASKRGCAACARSWAPAGDPETLCGDVASAVPSKTQKGWKTLLTWLLSDILEGSARKQTCCDCAITSEPEHLKTMSGDGLIRDDRCHSLKQVWRLLVWLHCKAKTHTTVSEACMSHSWITQVCSTGSKQHKESIHMSSTPIAEWGTSDYLPEPRDKEWVYL